MDLVKKILDASSCFEEEYSKRLFENRISTKACYTDAYFYGVVEASDSFLFDNYEKSTIPALQKKIEVHSPLAIAGAGEKGIHTLNSLVHAGYKVVAFLDNDKRKQGHSLQGIPILSFEDFSKNQDGIIAVIANGYYGNAFYESLKKNNYPDEHIFLNKGDLLVNIFGEEYFDIPLHKAGKKEVFIDAGGYDGRDSLKFLDWCKSEYKEIYVFEPDQDNCKMIADRMQGYKNVNVLDFALGKEDGDGYFDINMNNKEGSKLGKYPWMQPVHIRSIDSVLQGNEATFIKMDIEGAEMDALIGAKETIKKHRPILAISVYHRAFDLLNIPIYIKSIVPEYKMYLRHYSNTVYDLVLYCIPFHRSVCL